MTENMQAVSSGLLETGMETLTALILRASIQRSYTVSGSTCVQTISDPASVTIKLSNFGFSLGLIWVIIQFLVVILGFMMYIPWMISEFPMLPAIQIANDNLLFSFL